MRLFSTRAVVAVVVPLALMFGAQVFAVVPIDSGTPTALFPVPINTTAGDQYDAHVSGDIASYTSDTTVRYYNFFTGNDLVVPTVPDGKDELSGVSNSKMAFARLDLNTFKQIVMVFDLTTQTSTEIDPQPNSHRSSAAIGSNTVVFIDSDAAAGGEVFASRSGGSAIRVTSDTRIDLRPAVAPSGNLLVYESCESSPSNCDIRQAAWNGSSWIVTNLTNNSEPELNAQTDGSVVVYDAYRGGDRNICWQPVGGGSEQCLDLPGEQRNPSVSGGLILFESQQIGQANAAADLYVYDIAANRVYRITNTQDQDESLSDLTQLPDGRFRAVWANGLAPGRDVFAATFELPDIDAPIIDACQSPDGNWHANNVALHCTAHDVGRAGLANAADASFDLTTNLPAGQESQSVATGSRQICDAAVPQNCVTAGAIGGNKIDLRGPSVGVTAPASGATYALAQVVAANYSCQDNGSGLQSCTGPVASGQSIDTSSPGSKTFDVTGKDKVGNTTVVHVQYTVTGTLPTFASLIEQVRALPIALVTRTVLIATLRAAELAASQGHIAPAKVLLQVFVVEMQGLVALHSVLPSVGNNLISQARTLAASL